MKFTIEAREAYVYLVFNGKVDEPNLMTLAKQIREACEIHKTNYALVDFELATGGLSSSELYSMNIDFFNELKEETVVSYINPPDSWNMEVDSLSRSLALMRGHELYLFSNVNEFEKLFS